jgi:hypothetical protein
MKTQKLTAILAALILLSAAIAQEAEQEQKEKVSNTLTASCLVKVTCDPAIMPLTFETVDYLMHSSGVAGRAAAEVLGPREEPYEFEVLFSIEPLSVMPATPDLGVRPKPAARPPARRGSRPTRPRRAADEMGVLDEAALQDERAMEEMRHFERTAKYERKEYSEKEERRQARGRRVASRTPVPARTVRGAIAAPPPTAEQTLLFRLEVDLECCEVKPAAEEFMNALISNLRRTLIHAYREYDDGLHPDGVEGQRDLARYRLSAALGLIITRPDEQTREQLKNGVDLSNWSPEMSFLDAINELKHSVDPPLKMVVLWGDLLENAEIDQTTPTNMDALPEVRISKALDFLLKSVASGTGVELGYEIDGGIITIATADSLPSAERRLSQITHRDTPVEMLLDRKNELFRGKQLLDWAIATQEARRSAIEQQVAKINDNIAAKVEDSAVKEFEPLLRQLDAQRSLFERNKNEPEYSDRLTEVLEKIASTKLKIAERRDMLIRNLGGEQLAEFNEELVDLMIDLAQRRAEFEVVGRQLEEIEAQLKTASAVDPEISQIRLAQEELEIAERRLTELRIRRANLREPTVTVLGGV